MTKPHEIAIALNTDHQVADEMVATVREREARIDMLTAVNAALSRENAQLGAEIVTLRAMGKGTR